MAFEETLVCDGCSRVVDGGDRDQTLATLRDGGRAFDRHPRRDGEWVERPRDERWGSTRRHLCADCADAETFYDGAAVPPRDPALASPSQQETTP